VDEDARLAQDRVDERGLADVGPADDGHPDALRVRLDDGRGREGAGGLEQLGDAAAMLARDGLERLEPEAVEVGERVSCPAPSILFTATTMGRWLFRKMAAISSSSPVSRRARPPRR